MGDLIIRIIVLLAAFASVFLISQLVLGAAWRNRQKFAAVNKRLRLIKEGIHREEIVARLRKNTPMEFESVPPPIRHWLQSLQRSLFSAGVPFTMPQLLFAMGGGFVLVLVILLLAVGFGGFVLNSGIIAMAMALAGTTAVALPLAIINIRAQKKRKLMQLQFPVALDVFVRALRSGHPVASAIDLLTQEMDDPVGSEFGLVSDEIAYGMELTDALEAMAERWELEDMRMFVVCLVVQMETGGNLAEILENLSDVIRARESLYMKVRALSSEGRMTAWILSVLPMITFTLMFLINPGFYLNTASDSIFIYGFIILVTLYISGIIWIRKMVDLKV